MSSVVLFQENMATPLTFTLKDYLIKPAKRYFTVPKQGGHCPSSQTPRTN